VGSDLDAALITGAPAPGERLVAPAVCALADATLLLTPGWRGSRACRRHDRADARMSGDAVCGPDRAADHGLGALHAACEEMGALLIRAAHSPNIKERRDCSSALFDARGEMIMQAEHIPVHLGAMPAAVAAVLDREQPPRSLLDPQRSVRGRHPPARHHGDQRGSRRRSPDRLRGHARAPRRRRRPNPRDRCRPTAARSVRRGC
jgi:hypothetical protein